MNRRHVFTLSVIPVLALILTSAAEAQQKTLKEQLAGTWTVVSWEQIGKDGNKFERFGANPQGVNVFDANGRFVVMFARADLPKLAARDPMKSTPQENKAIMEGSIAYFGTYTVDEAAKTISMRVETSTFPNQVGIEQRRTVSISGNELRLTNTTTLTGNTINYVLRRLTSVASR
jgi:Lipocalin-like domain